MKTRLHIFAITCLITLNLTSLDAMEQPRPTYQLVSAVHELFVSGTVTFVKQISDQYLVVYNSHRAVLLFDITDNYKCVRNWTLANDDAPHYLNDVFIHQDGSVGQLLLIVHNDHHDSLYIHRFDSPFSTYGPVYIKHKFKIAPAMVDSKKTLVMINTEDNSAYSVDLTCAPQKRMFKSDYEDLFPMKPIHCFSIDDVIDEGLLVNCETYQQEGLKQFLLPSEMFEIQLLTEKEKKLVCSSSKFERLREICCYHKTLKGTLYLGHSGGTASIWKPKK